MVNNPPAFIRRPDFTTRPYQVGLIDAVEASLRTQGRACLAAAPGSGKTEMAIELARRHLEASADNKVLFLTHGLTCLRDNIAGRLQHYMPGAQELQAGQRLDARARAVVALPGAVQEARGFTMVIVDEAHERFYIKRGNENDGQMQRVLANNGDAQVVTLTGSPGVFKARGWPMHYVSVEQILANTKGVVTVPLFEHIGVPSKLVLGDYNADDELPSGRLSMAELEAAIGVCIEQLGKRIAWHRESNVLGRVVDRVRHHFGSKCLVRAASVADAAFIVTTLQGRGFAAVDCSSAADEDGEALNLFKTDENRFAVVVDRGILGYDFPDLTTVIDMSFSLNPYLTWQLCCRLNRVGATGSNKQFFKVIPQGATFWAHRASLAYAACLTLDEVYRADDGEWKTKKFPMKGGGRKPSGAECQRCGYARRDCVCPRKPGTAGPEQEPDVALPDYTHIMELLEHRDEVGASVEYTTFKRLREQYTGNRVEKTLMELMELAKRGEPKPIKGSAHNNALRAYLNPQYPYFRSEYYQQLSILRPEWLPKPPAPPPTDAEVLASAALCVYASQWLKKDKRCYLRAYGQKQRGNSSLWNKCVALWPAGAGRAAQAAARKPLTPEKARQMASLVDSESRRQRVLALHQTNMGRMMIEASASARKNPQRMAGRCQRRRLGSPYVASLSKTKMKYKALGSHSTERLAYQHIYWYVVNVLGQREYLRGWLHGDDEGLAAFLKDFEPSAEWKAKYCKPLTT